MRHRHFITSIVLVLSFLASPSVGAKDLNGRLGIGLEQSLGGVSGLTVRYWPWARFGINGIIGADIITENGGDLQDTTLTASVGFVYNIARSLHANLGLGAKVGLGFQNLPGRTPESVIQINIEIPLSFEFFLSDSFSLGLAAGVLLSFVPEEGAILEPEGHGGATVPGTFNIGIGAVNGTISGVYYF
jgi:hypothetical protein